MLKSVAVKSPHSFSIRNRYWLFDISTSPQGAPGAPKSDSHYCEVKNAVQAPSAST